MWPNAERAGPRCNSTGLGIMMLILDMTPNHGLERLRQQPTQAMPGGPWPSQAATATDDLGGSGGGGAAQKRVLRFSYERHW